MQFELITETECYTEKDYKFQDFPSTRSGPSFSILPEPEPMQVGRTRCSQEENQQRVTTNKCLYCGKSDHYVKTCQLSLKRRNPLVMQEILVGNLTSSLEKNFCLFDIICVYNNNFPIQALVDSGAEQNNQP